jgi:hypothetical protein
MMDDDDAVAFFMMDDDDALAFFMMDDDDAVTFGVRNPLASDQQWKATSHRTTNNKKREKSLTRKRP